MKKCILVLCLLTAFNALAEEEIHTSGRDCGEDCFWSYDTTSHTLSITGSGKMTDYVSYDEQGNRIETPENRPWNHLISEIENVSVSGTTSIGALAFVNANALKNINISEGVTSIEYGALAFTGLTGIRIPDSVTSIGVSAFYNDTLLSDISFGVNSNLQSIDRYAFSQNALTNFNTPESLIFIGRGAFESVENLVNITINDGTEIGRAAFTGTKMMENIVIGENCILDENAFYGTSAAIYCPEALGCEDKGSENIIPYSIDKSGALKVGDDYYATAQDLANGTKCVGGLTDDCITSALNRKISKLVSKGKYCSTVEECQALVYADYHGEILKIGQKSYQSLKDLMSGNYIPKRIYTIEEAERVSTKTGNTFKLRYK
ncbi:MAG: leucine-rich repeat domain-containing protein [Alphaproteobacteria bacterium]|nr:leucine-rich repeat domain-containing protein [Alphaproteobacteria bacterium]